MKTHQFVYISAWTLVVVTGASGFGLSHLYEKHFSAHTHVIIGALGQLLPLLGFCLLALYIEKRKPDENHTTPPGASS